MKARAHTERLKASVVTAVRLALASVTRRGLSVRWSVWALALLSRGCLARIAVSSSLSSVAVLALPMRLRAALVLQQVSADPAARRLAEQRALAAITWKMDLDAVRGEGRVEGEARGEEKARTAALRASIVDLCDVLEIALTDEQRAALAAMTWTELDSLRLRIKSEHRRPE